MDKDDNGPGTVNSRALLPRADGAIQSGIGFQPVHSRFALPSDRLPASFWRDALRRIRWNTVAMTKHRPPCPNDAVERLKGLYRSGATRSGERPRFFASLRMTMPWPERFSSIGERTRRRVPSDAPSRQTVCDRPRTKRCIPLAPLADEGVRQNTRWRVCSPFLN